MNKGATPSRQLSAEIAAMQTKLRHVELVLRVWAEVQVW